MQRASCLIICKGLLHIQLVDLERICLLESEHIGIEWVVWLLLVQLRSRRVVLKVRSQLCSSGLRLRNRKIVGAVILSRWELRLLALSVWHRRVLDGAVSSLIRVGRVERGGSLCIHSELPFRICGSIYSKVEGMEAI